MSMAEEWVIDTTVLQKANAPLHKSSREHSLFRKRLRLLEHVQSGRAVALISSKLLSEYERQVPIPSNDYVQAFFGLVLDPGRRTSNWAAWPGGRSEKARKCRFPKHDDHVLRTAIRPKSTTVYCEDAAMLKADRCIYRAFRVRIRQPA